MIPLRLSLVLSLVLAACGGTGTTGTSTTVASTTSEATTTVPEDTTTTAAEATTTTAGVTTTTAPLYVVPIPWEFPAVFGASGDPHGSGCVVEGGLLPDGLWFGYAEAVGGGVITFDLACYFTGAAAEAEATADGTEVFDNYIRNQNPMTFPVPISPLAQVFYIDATLSDAGFFPQPIAVSSWPTAASYLPCPGEFCGVWLYVNGGQATGVVEMFQP
ncbi:MAG: hypothetical protein WEA29_05260 [Acidimicrobiia bacterium]